MATPICDGLQRRRVVDAVAGHGDDMAERLEGLDDLQLLLGPHAREDAHVADARRASSSGAMAEIATPGQRRRRKHRCRRGGRFPAPSRDNRR
jgi:hypothetical protein